MTWPLSLVFVELVRWTEWMQRVTNRRIMREDEDASLVTLCVRERCCNSWGQSFRQQGGRIGSGVWERWKNNVVFVMFEVYGSRRFIETTEATPRKDSRHDSGEIDQYSGSQCGCWLQPAKPFEEDQRWRKNVCGWLQAASSVGLESASMPLCLLRYVSRVVDTIGIIGRFGPFG